MNIGIVTTWCERGAAYVSRIYHDVLKNDYDCYIYARGGEIYDKSNNWNWPNVHWGKVIKNGRPMAINRRDFELWIKNNNIDIIIFNEQQYWLPIIWCKELGIKTLAYIDYYTEETLPFFNLYDAVICNTKRHCEALDFHDNLIYIPWGTDLTTYKPTKMKKNDNFLIFFHSCGVSPERKGTDLLIQSFSLIKDKNIKLIIHTQIPLCEKLDRNIISILNEEKRIEVIERSVSAPGLYHLGDVYVYPTYLEGIGLTIAEAIASGLPAIVPDAAPMNEFVHESFSRLTKVCRLFSRKDGYYWPKVKVDINSLSGDMQYFVDNKHQLETFKVKAREHAEKHLNWDVNSSNLADSIKEVEFSFADKVLLNECIKYEAKKRVIPYILEVPITFIMRLIVKCKYAFNVN